MAATAEPRPTTTHAPPSLNGSGPARPAPVPPAVPPMPADARPGRQTGSAGSTSDDRSRISELRLIVRRTFRRS
jgi:hypothetical protein